VSLPFHLRRSTFQEVAERQKDLRTIEFLRWVHIIVGPSYFEEESSLPQGAVQDSDAIHMHQAPPDTVRSFISHQLLVRIFTHITDKATEAQRRQVNQLNTQSL
jgi:hypothetical protein